MEPPSWDFPVSIGTPNSITFSDFFFISEGDAWDTRFGETGHCVGCSSVGLRSLGAA